MRYLHPNQEDTKNGAILCSRILTRALGFILSEGKGISIKLDGKDYVVFSQDKQVNIIPGDDIPDGTELSVSE